MTHLFFADDSIMFSKASMEECEIFLDILNIYGRASGQCINFDKSFTLFYLNTPRRVEQQICQISNINSIVYFEKYLRLPSMIGRSKNHDFQSLKDSVWKRIQGWKEWKEKVLSKRGKEVLIKAIAQAIPTYSMDCFKIPAALCQELSGLMAKFWCGGTKLTRGKFTS